MDVNACGRPGTCQQPYCLWSTTWLPAAARSPVVSSTPPPPNAWPASSKPWATRPESGWSLVAAHADGETCVCALTDPVGLSQPTVSHHLKQLVDAGLLTREQRGRWSFYRVVDGALDSLAGALSAPTSLP